MAGRLTRVQRRDLAVKISNETWRDIAPIYLDLDEGFLSSLQTKHRENIRAQNEEMISKWANKNSVDQVKNLARILYQAADEDGGVDPFVVEQILKVTKEGTVITSTGPASQSASYSSAAASPASSGKKLTEPMLRNLASCVVSEEDLRDLGTFGFGVREKNIDRALNDNNRKINAAATQVIKEWARVQEDDEKAYNDLCAILRKIRRNAWIKELED